MRRMSAQKVALITGGAKRVGRAIAERLAQAGFAVAVTFNKSGENAQALARELGGMAIQADLTDPLSAVAAVAQAFTSRFERLDVLVNNASLYETMDLDKTDLVLCRRMMAIHYESPLLLCQRFAPLLRNAGGHVVNMVDLMVERPAPRYVAYLASKAALWNLTLSLSRELAPEVTVNGIAPGVVQWPADYPVADQEKYLKRVPLARPGSPTDVAEAVHFLATTGSYITGQIIRLDGGRSVT
jgi:pteridine reductase